MTRLRDRSNGNTQHSTEWGILRGSRGVAPRRVPTAAVPAPAAAAAVVATSGRFGCLVISLFQIVFLVVLYVVV